MLFKFSIITSFINKYLITSKLKKFNQTNSNKLDEIFLSTPRESTIDYDKMENKLLKN